MLHNCKSTCIGYQLNCGGEAERLGYLWDFGGEAERLGIDNLVCMLLVIFFVLILVF